MIRSILSVLTSIVVWGVLWVAANAALAGALPAEFDERGVTTDPLLLVTFILICAALCVLAGWLCAVIAKHSLMRHVAVLAVIQLAIGIAVQVSVWDLMPLWYHLTFLAVVVPLHLLGGRIRASRRHPAGFAQALAPNEGA